MHVNKGKKLNLLWIYLEFCETLCPWQKNNKVAMRCAEWWLQTKGEEKILHKKATR